MLVISTEQAAVPVGGSAAGPGMSMQGAAGSRIQLSMRDIAGQTLRIPGGRAGVAIFVEASGCSTCIHAVRTAARALAQIRAAATLLVVGVDASTSRSALAAFARSAGEPPARYVVDDRNSTLANAFGASALGEVVVYTASGRILERTGTPAVSQLARAVSHAGA